MIPAPASHSRALGAGPLGAELLVPTPGSSSIGSSINNVDWSGSNRRAAACSSVQVPLCGGAAFSVAPMADGSEACDQLSGCVAQVPRQLTQMPYVTGTSVLGLTFKGGVLIASDTLGAYGSTKRYKNVQRVVTVNDRVVVAASGEVSDFQHLSSMLEQQGVEDHVRDDGITLSPSDVYTYLVRVMYYHRNKFDPLWNTLVIGGVDALGTPFLGMVGMIGTHYTDTNVTTGFANMLARPLFRDQHRPDMEEDEAMELMKTALRVCYYRDKQSINKFQVTKVTRAGVTISEPFSLEMRWDHKKFAAPTEWAVGAW